MNWPADYIKPAALYAMAINKAYKCPACEGDTALMEDADPVSLSDANHIAFDAYYSRLERKREEEAAKARKLLEQQSQEIAGLPEAA